MFLKPKQPASLPNVCCSSGNPSALVNLHLSLLRSSPTSAMQQERFTNRRPTVTALTLRPQFPQGVYREAGFLTPKQIICRYTGVMSLILFAWSGGIGAPRSQLL